MISARYSCPFAWSVFPGRKRCSISLEAGKGGSWNVLRPLSRNLDAIETAKHPDRTPSDVSFTPRRPCRRKKTKIGKPRHARWTQKRCSESEMINVAKPSCATSLTHGNLLFLSCHVLKLRRDASREGFPLPTFLDVSNERYSAAATYTHVHKKTSPSQMRLE